MKNFFSRVFSSCLGCILALVVIFGLLMLVGAVAGSMGKGNIEKGSVLLLELDTPIPELTGNVNQGQFSFESMPDVGLHDIKKTLEKASTDNRISGIILKTTGMVPYGTVTASEIRESLKRFRDSTDKFIYTYADNLTNNSYLIASSSDSIFVNPNGIVDVNGFGTMIPFFKGGMEKLGVDMEVFYAGQFKSATEPFRRKEMSEQNRTQTREYLTDNYELYLDEVSEARGIPESNIRDIINELDFSNLPQCISKGLIDDERHWYQVEDLVREKLNIKRGKLIDYISISDYYSKIDLSSGTSKNRIAVVYAEGEVQYATEQKGNINESTYHKVFDKLRKDKKVKAVVLRVNSPGGSAFTSDAIWREMLQLKDDGIPVIASFGDYAASGGYYVAACADTIVSHPKTLTGSIGVFSMLPKFKEFMNDKMGITFDTVKTSPYAITLNSFYDFRDDERQAIQNFTDELYAQFLDRVAVGRETSTDAIHEVAQGRVWTGQKAVDKGLVDVLGGLDRAIEIAAEKADISDDYKVVEYPRITKEFWEEILLGLSAQAKATLGHEMSPMQERMQKHVEEFYQVVGHNEPLARLPYRIDL